MRITNTVLAAALTTACFTTAAEAKRGLGGGHYEFMEFVADFNAPAEISGGKTLSLCHLIDKNHAVYIPIWYESHGYVLAENRCDTDSYLSLTAEAFAEAQASGVIPAGIPARPSLDLTRQLPPYLWGLALVIGIIALIRKASRSRTRSTEMVGLPVHVRRVLDVACHAAKSDGTVGDQEIEMIQAVVQKTTDTRLGVEQIRRVATNCEKTLQQQDFAKFAEGLDVPQKELLMRVALLVVGADEQLAKSEQKFLSGLAAGLSITPARFQSLMLEMR